MAKKRYTPEVLIRKLREAEVLQGQCQTIAQAQPAMAGRRIVYPPGAEAPQPRWVVGLRL